MGRLRILKAGETAMLIETDGLDAAMGLYDSIQDARQRLEDSHRGNDDGSNRDEGDDAAFAAIREVIPAARTVLVSYEPLLVSARELGHAIRRLGIVTTANHDDTHARTVVVPVVYDGEDLEGVAKVLSMSVQSLIAWHTAKPWRAAFTGFAPGFAYLTGGSRIHDVPRRAEPRLSVPAGSVGLAGRFSGVYPRASSGGWQLIGATDMVMWDDRGDPPATISPGDRVSFRAVREHVAVMVVPTARHGFEPTGRTPGDNPALRVMRPGILAVIEDDGRSAARLGVTGSGSADRMAAHAANALVGNPAGEPVIELTGGNAEFAALRDVVIAVTGAPVPIVIRGVAEHSADVGTDGSSADMATTRRGVRETSPEVRRVEQRIERQEAFLLRSGESMTLATPSSGLRDYLAVQGGFAVRRVLGSASSDTMARLGPRPLAAGEVLYAAGHPHRTVGLPMSWAALPTTTTITELALELGPRDDWFAERTLADLPKMIWTLTPRSNRVGLRLHGDVGLRRSVTSELVSEATVPGSIEVPSDGQPVLFLCDQPVTGGYPVIGVLTRRALATAAQLPIGAKIRLVPLDPCRRHHAFHGPSKEG